MKIKFISGCSSGKPNLVILSLNGKGIVLDCGFQYEMPNFEKIDEEVKHILITHAHADHIGGITLLKRKFPEAKVYMSAPTKEIGKVTLSNLEIKPLKIKPRSHYKIPLKEIEEILSTVDIIKENSIIKIDDNIKVLAISSGHLLGALSYLIKINSNTLFYTGDISVVNLPLAGQLSLEYTNIDLVISESNFSIGEETFEESMKKIVSIISNTLKTKGKVLLPTPTAGRAQEIAAYLAYKMISNEIPYTTIYVDGSIKDVIKIYDLFSSKIRGYLRDTYLNSRSSGLIKLVTDEIRKEILKSKDPYIILTTSANLKYGPALTYTQELILDDRSSIIFTGKVEEESLAKKILYSKRGELIDFKGVALGRRCKVYMIEINEHGNVSLYINLLQKLMVKGVTFIHGNEITKKYLLQLILDKNKNVYTTEPKEFDILDLNLIFKICKKSPKYEEETLEFILERIIQEVKEKFNKTEMLSEKDLFNLFSKNEILEEIKNFEKGKLIFFIALRYAMKYSYKNDWIDFQFPSILSESIGTILERILGKNSVMKMYLQFNETASKLFKNLILKGGTMKANLGIKFPNIEKLEKTLKSFEENFSKFNVHAPTIEEIKKLCKEEVYQNEKLKETYKKIFGEI